MADTTTLNHTIKCHNCQKFVAAGVTVVVLTSKNNFGDVSTAYRHAESCLSPREAAKRAQSAAAAAPIAPIVDAATERQVAFAASLIARVWTPAVTGSMERPSLNSLRTMSRAAISDMIERLLDERRLQEA